MCNIFRTITEFFSIKYTRNKILYSLSMLLILSVCIIIRYCQYPLLIRTKLLEKIFISTSNDNTFYNIAISYVAAFIFYIFQVYIPVALNHYKSYKLLSASISKEIDLLQKMVFICKYSLNDSDNNIDIDLTKASFYFKIVTDENVSLHKFTYELSYNPCKEQLSKLHSEIVANPNLSLLDFAFLYKYCSIPINDFLIFMDNIANNMISHTDMRITSKQILDDIEKTISNLIRDYEFFSSTVFDAKVSVAEQKKYNNNFENTIYPEYKCSLLLTLPTTNH